VQSQGKGIHRFAVSKAICNVEEGAKEEKCRDKKKNEVHGEG